MICPHCSKDTEKTLDNKELTEQLRAAIKRIEALEARPYYWGSYQYPYSYKDSYPTWIGGGVLQDNTYPFLTYTHAFPVQQTV